MKKTLFLLLFLISEVSSASVIVGNDAINRSAHDSWSNFVQGLTTETFLTSGTVASWDVFTNNSGTLGMLLLRNTSGSAYEIIGADFETADAGLNSFTFTPDTGIADVLAGDILGLFIGTSKVDFDFVSSGSDVANWCGSNGCVTSGNTSLLDAGTTINLTGQGNRTYSANVTMVPEPSIIALMGLGLAGLGFARRRKQKA